MVRLHYLDDGNVNFALTINRSEFFVPVIFLFKALAEVWPMLLLFKQLRCVLIHCTAWLAAEDENAFVTHFQSVLCCWP